MSSSRLLCSLFESGLREASVLWKHVVRNPIFR